MWMPYNTDVNSALPENVVYVGSLNVGGNLVDVMLARIPDFEPNWDIFGMFVEGSSVMYYEMDGSTHYNNVNSNMKPVDLLVYV